MEILKGIHGAIVPSEEEITDCLNKLGWLRIIDTIEETFLQEAVGCTISPPKTIMVLEGHNNDYRVMPSFMQKYSQFCGTKIISCCVDNPSQYNLPLAMGIYVLNDAITQKTIMICDACALTAYRTAAATAVAVRALSNEDSEKLGIIGCGKQSYYHIPAIKAVRNIKDIYIHDINEHNMNKLVDNFPNIDIKKSKKDKIFKECDIVVTLTPTDEPHIFINDIVPSKDMLICAVGGDNEDKIEFEPGVLTLVDHFCDSYDQVAHTGLVSRALEEGIVDKNRLKSLGDFMKGKRGFCYPNKENKMFISTGVALEDLALAILIYDNYKRMP